MELRIFNKCPTRGPRDMPLICEIPSRKLTYPTPSGEKEKSSSKVPLQSVFVGEMLGRYPEWRWRVLQKIQNDSAGVWPSISIFVRFGDWISRGPVEPTKGSIPIMDRGKHAYGLGLAPNCLLQPSSQRLKSFFFVPWTPHQAQDWHFLVVVSKTKENWNLFGCLLVSALLMLKMSGTTCCHFHHPKVFFNFDQAFFFFRRNIQPTTIILNIDL